MKTILVIEEFVAVQQFLRQTLESLGYKTLGAANGQNAYKILVAQENMINLVITDYYLVDGAGSELVTRMRENSRLKQIPVIFLTAASDRPLAQNTAELSLTSWVSIPYRRNTLLAEIKKRIL